MKTLIYIGNELCQTHEQLKNCFLSVTSINDDVYWDLLDYGKSKELPKFLKKIGELQVAEEFDLIDVNLEDSLYFYKMASVILGEDTAKSKLGLFNRESEGFNSNFFESLMRITSEISAKLSTSVENVQKEMVERELSLKSLEFNVGNNDFRMVRIPLMGNDAAYNDADFYIGQVPVTQGLWKAVMGNDDKCLRWLEMYYSSPGRNKLWMSSEQLLPYNAMLFGDSKPMIGVHIFDILEFIKKLNIITNKNFRLPTDQEWHIAANEDSKNGKKQYGKDKEDIQNYAWFAENSEMELHNVAKKRPNNIGVCDLYGNIWERVLDYNIMLGGSFKTPLNNIFDAKSSQKEYDVGFRLVLIENNNCGIAEDVDFVDLGLSVLWERNCGVLYDVSKNTEKPREFEVKELLEQCDIRTISNGVYKITGPNGNYIYRTCGWYRIGYGRHNNSSVAVNFGLHQIKDVYDKNIRFDLMIKRL